MWMRDPTSGLLLPRPVFFQADAGRKGAAGNSAEAKAISFVQAYANQTSGISSNVLTTTLNIGALPIGWDRYIVIASVLWDNDDSPGAGSQDTSITSDNATLGGNAAVWETNTWFSNGDEDSGDETWIDIGLHLAMFGPINTGTTAQLIRTIVGHTHSMEQWSAGVYRVVGLNSTTPTDTGTGTTNLTTLTIPSNGFGVVCSTGHASGSGNDTPQNHNENYSGTGMVSNAGTAGTPCNAFACGHNLTAGTPTIDHTDSERFLGAAWAFVA